MTQSFLETDLYQPVHDYLVRNGYTVRSEVKYCDITAVKDDDLIVIELKKSINLTLLIQATQRQKMTDSVYVAVPEPKESVWSKKWRKIQHVLKRLELGLILVSKRRKRYSVQVVFHPLPLERRKDNRKRRAVLREIEDRSGDYNQGGSVKKKLMTAYRESAIHIAYCLQQHGPLSPKALRALGTVSKTQSILYSNHYGWFDRIDKGLYSITVKGKQALQEYAEIVKQLEEESP